MQTALNASYLGGSPDLAQGGVLGGREEGMEGGLQALLVVVPRKEGRNLPDVRPVKQPQRAEEERSQGVVRGGVVSRQHGDGRQQLGPRQPQEARRVLA